MPGRDATCLTLAARRVALRCVRFDPWRKKLEQPAALNTSSTLMEARVDRAFRDPAKVVHVHEHAARVDLSYAGIVAAVKTASSAAGVKKSMADDNRQTLAPENYYRTKKGDPIAGTRSRLDAVETAVGGWKTSTGLLCLDVVLPVSKASPPRLEVRKAPSGRQDIYVHVDQKNLGLLVGDHVATRIVAALTNPEPDY